jgi:hypothetical protein
MQDLPGPTKRPASRGAGRGFPTIRDSVKPGLARSLRRGLRRTAGPAPMLPFIARNLPARSSPPCTPPPHRATPGNASVAFMRHQ